MKLVTSWTGSEDLYVDTGRIHMDQVISINRKKRDFSENVYFSPGLLRIRKILSGDILSFPLLPTSSLRPEVGGILSVKDQLVEKTHSTAFVGASTTTTNGSMITSSMVPKSNGDLLWSEASRSVVMITHCAHFKMYAHDVIEELGCLSSVGYGEDLATGHDETIVGWRMDYFLRDVVSRVDVLLGTPGDNKGGALLNNYCDLNIGIYFRSTNNMTTGESLGFGHLCRQENGVGESKERGLSSINVESLVVLSWIDDVAVLRRELSPILCVSPIPLSSAVFDRGRMTGPPGHLCFGVRTPASISPFIPPRGSGRPRRTVVGGVMNGIVWYTNSTLSDCASDVGVPTFAPLQGPIVGRDDIAESDRVAGNGVANGVGGGSSRRNGGHPEALPEPRHVLLLHPDTLSAGMSTPIPYPSDTIGLMGVAHGVGVGARAEDDHGVLVEMVDIVEVVPVLTVPACMCGVVLGISESVIPTGASYPMREGGPGIGGADIPPVTGAVVLTGWVLGDSPTIMTSEVGGMAPTTTRVGTGVTSTVGAAVGAERRCRGRVVAHHTMTSLPLSPSIIRCVSRFTTPGVAVRVGHDICARDVGLVSPLSSFPYMRWVKWSPGLGTGEQGIGGDTVPTATPSTWRGVPGHPSDGGLGDLPSSTTTICVAAPASGAGVQHGALGGGGSSSTTICVAAPASGAGVQHGGLGDLPSSTIICVAAPASGAGVQHGGLGDLPSSTTTICVAAPASGAGVQHGALGGGSSSTTICVAAPASGAGVQHGALGGGSSSTTICVAAPASGAGVQHGGVGGVSSLTTVYVAAPASGGGVQHGGVGGVSSLTTVSVAAPASGGGVQHGGVGGVSSLTTVYVAAPASGGGVQHGGVGGVSSLTTVYVAAPASGGGVQHGGVGGVSSLTTVYVAAPASGGGVQHGGVGGVSSLTTVYVAAPASGGGVQHGGVGGVSSLTTVYVAAPASGGGVQHGGVGGVSSLTTVYVAAPASGGGVQHGGVGDGMHSSCSLTNFENAALTRGVQRGVFGIVFSTTTGVAVAACMCEGLRGGCGAAAVTTTCNAVLVFPPAGAQHGGWGSDIMPTVNTAVATPPVTFVAGVEAEDEGGECDLTLPPPLFLSRTPDHLAGDPGMPPTGIGGLFTVLPTTSTAGVSQQADEVDDTSIRYLRARLADHAPVMVVERHGVGTGGVISTDVTTTMLGVGLRDVATATGVAGLDAVDHARLITRGAVDVGDVAATTAVAVDVVCVAGVDSTPPPGDVDVVGVGGVDSTPPPGDVDVVCVAGVDSTPPPGDVDVVCAAGVDSTPPPGDVDVVCVAGVDSTPPPGDVDVVCVAGVDSTPPPGDVDVVCVAGVDSTPPPGAVDVVCVAGVDSTPPPGDVDVVCVAGVDSTPPPGAVDVVCVAGVDSTPPPGDVDVVCVAGVDSTPPPGDVDVVCVAGVDSTPPPSPVDEVCASGVDRTHPQRYFLEILVKQVGLTQLKSDQSIYVMTRMRNGRRVQLIASVYVDDIVVAYGDGATLDEFRRGLGANYAIKDMGFLKYCLGMHIEQLPDFSISISQLGLVQELLCRDGMASYDVRTHMAPAPPGERLSNVNCPATPKGRQLMLRAPYDTYRNVVGVLMYLTGATRPRTGSAVNQLARFVTDPDKKHLEVPENLLRYPLAGTRGRGIVHLHANKVQGVLLEHERTDGHWKLDLTQLHHHLYESFGNNVIMFADSDWGGNPDTGDGGELTRLYPVALTYTDGGGGLCTTLGDDVQATGISDVIRDSAPGFWRLRCGYTRCGDYISLISRGSFSPLVLGTSRVELSVGNLDPGAFLNHTGTDEQLPHFTPEPPSVGGAGGAVGATLEARVYSRVDIGGGTSDLDFCPALSDDGYVGVTEPGTDHPAAPVISRHPAVLHPSRSHPPVYFLQPDVDLTSGDTDPLARGRLFLPLTVGGVAEVSDGGGEVIGGDILLAHSCVAAILDQSAVGLAVGLGANIALVTGAVLSIGVNRQTTRLHQLDVAGVTCLDLEFDSTLGYVDIRAGGAHYDILAERLPYWSCGGAGLVVGPPVAAADEGAVAPPVRPFTWYGGAFVERACVDDVGVPYEDDAILPEDVRVPGLSVSVRDSGSLQSCPGLQTEQDRDFSTPSDFQLGSVQGLLGGVGVTDTGVRPGVTSPDIDCAVHRLACFGIGLGEEHWEASERLLQSSAVARDLGLHYYRGNKLPNLLLEWERRDDRGGGDRDIVPLLHLVASFDGNAVITIFDPGGISALGRNTTGCVACVGCTGLTRLAIVIPSSAEVERRYALGDGILGVLCNHQEELVNSLGFPQPGWRPGCGGAGAGPVRMKNRGSVFSEDNMDCCLEEVFRHDCSHDNRTKRIIYRSRSVLDHTEMGGMCVIVDYHVGTAMNGMADLLTKVVGDSLLVAMDRLTLLGVSGCCLLLSLRDHLIGCWHGVCAAEPSC